MIIIIFCPPLYLCMSMLFPKSVTFLMKKTEKKIIFHSFLVSYKCKNVTNKSATNVNSHKCCNITNKISIFKFNTWQCPVVHLNSKSSYYVYSWNYNFQSLNSWISKLQVQYIILVKAYQYQNLTMWAIVISNQIHEKILTTK